MTFVLDASVTLAWALEEANLYSDGIFGRLSSETALVPDIWALEVANGLLVAERGGRVSGAEVSQAHGILRDLPITASSASLDIALGPILALARTHDLTAYDASYLDLALREGLALATVDGNLRTAARKSGVPLA